MGWTTFGKQAERVIVLSECHDSLAAVPFGANTRLIGASAASEALLPTDATKEQISARLDPDVVAKLREAGPGWQSRINALLRQALGLEAPRSRAA